MKKSGKARCFSEGHAVPLHKPLSKQSGYDLVSNQFGEGGCEAVGRGKSIYPLSPYLIIGSICSIGIYL